ncbi:MAG TPA: class I SAM-dependent methyltransferase [Thermoanaerobaculia bacterium]|jgi:cyclopropane fatty-acyl-phospholipid synthase-like methyltransferase
MPLGYIRALTLLHRTFRAHPAAHRIHILGRFLSTPFLRTLDLIPAGSGVLDIGAGHGLLARLIAEECAADVVAVDPDLRKVLIAYEHPRIRFVAGYDDCIRGEFDVVTMYDVIYRLAPEQRDALFARVYERLKPGGIFLLKDIDPAHRLKWRWNQIQEWISDRAFGLTIGEGLHPESREQISERMARAGFVDFEWKRVDSGYPHAHIVYTARKR